VVVIYRETEKAPQQKMKDFKDKVAVINLLQK
jgi:hypothetical protein